MEKSVLITQELLDKKFTAMVEKKIWLRHMYKLKGFDMHVYGIEEELGIYGVTLEDNSSGVRWTRKET